MAVPAWCGHGIIGHLKKNILSLLKTLRLFRAVQSKQMELQQCVKTKSLHAVTRSGVSQYKYINKSINFSMRHDSALCIG